MDPRSLRLVPSLVLVSTVALWLWFPGVAHAAGPSPGEEDALTPPPVGEADAKGGVVAPDVEAEPEVGAGGGPGEVVVPPAAPESWIYQPRHGFQMSAFFASHPTDTYLGILLAGHLHVSPRISLSADLRLGGGHDNDGDQFVHSLIILGGSAYFWFRGHQPERAMQPYVRLGLGYLWMPDERFDDGTDDDDDDWDKRRNYKKNGVAAPGHSDGTFSEAMGFRFVLIPTSGLVEIGASFDVELALYQDRHYGLEDSGLMLTVGLTMVF